ncbi:MAG: BlaI/MecI/CopY family transcriptional regulator [Patescibacteria group bacterium]|nr:BlaI/MecI/CopY family transcriptional regulator [Patescibacteria group bacterium]
MDIAELPRYARDIQHSFEITVQEYEAFHVLLRHKGWYSAEEIRSFIAQNRVARSQMYNVLKSLESKNLITSKKQGRKILYKINLSEEILTPFLQQEKQLEKQQRHVSDLIEMLQQVNEHAEENWHIDIIPIRNQGELWEFFDSILHEAEGTILYTFLRHGGTKKIINPQAWNDYEKKLIEKDITLKSFMDQEKLTKHYKHWNKRLATQFGITTKDIDRLLFENIKQEYIKVQ